MQDSENDAWPGTARLARSLGRTWWGQILGAVAVAAFFGGLTVAAWNMRSLTVSIVCAMLILKGVRSAWRLLPIPVATRARWKEEDRLSKDHPAALFRGSVWVGIVLLLGMSYSSGKFEWPRSSDFVLAGLFIITGVVSIWICRHSARRKSTGSH